MRRMSAFTPNRRRLYAAAPAVLILLVGLLAKGPVAVVLTLLPVVAWTAWKKQWPAVLRRMPWAGGTILMLLIALPWYLAAERATPGFLDSYIVGEHWIIYGGLGERLEFIHRAHSRDNFAKGAVRAAKWIVGQPTGFYDMQDVLGLKK